MKNLVYYFIFENEYMNDIVDRLCTVFKLSREKICDL